MKRVTGLGGVFFKAENPKQIKEWYEKHLGIADMFQWRELHNPEATEPATTAWCPFDKNTTYFSPSEKPFMFNYRVENLEGLLEILKKEGVTIVGDVQTEPYGKFGWILDPEGNKIELWEPVDSGFDGQ